MKKVTLILFVFAVIASMYGCGTMTASIRTTPVVKFEGAGYKDVKSIAILPAEGDNREAAEEMNYINAKVLEGAGYKIVNTNQIQDYLGKDYKLLEKDPMNYALISKIADKFNVESVLYCKVNEWIVAQRSVNAYRSSTSLNYVLINAKTQKPLSKISGNVDDITILPNSNYIRDLAAKLVAYLIGQL